MRVLITGAAGSGTSTVAQALSDKMQAVLLEADNFLWLPTVPPPFRSSVYRPREKYFSLLLCKSTHAA
jgi:uridine kinase